MIITHFLLITGTLLLWDMKRHRRPEIVSLGDAAMWSLVYVAGAMIFALDLSVHRGPDAASLFLAGYVMEKALSVDNLMVFVAIFAYFRIPDGFQHKVLHYGIVSAVICRLIMVGGGWALLSLSPLVGMVFACLVLGSAAKMLTGGDEEVIDFSNQWYARWSAKLLPFINDMRHGLLVVTEGGRKIGTPLLMALIAIEVSDVLFSFDSVPAVIAVTRDPVLIYSAMIFAILGLRQLYFVLTALIRYLCHLEKAVIAVLVFIGGKMMLQSFGDFSAQLGRPLPFPTAIQPTASLIVVLVVLATGVVASMIWPDSGNEEHGIERG